MSNIKDVAKLAGVSTSTVSRVLSGNVPVDKATRLKVLEAVKQLRYQPNALAKGLKEGHTDTIALLIPNIRHEIFPAVAKGVEDVARKHGFTVILCNTDENLKVEVDYVEKLKKKWVDGFIFATAVNSGEHILALKEQGLPVVLLIRHLDINVDAVIINNFKAGYEAISYLLGQGHREIAIICSKLEILLFQNRLDGCKKALEDAGIPLREELIIRNLDDGQSAYQQMLGMLSSGIVPDAVFAMSDYKAIGVMRAIKDFGLGIPDDISVMGFGDLDVSCLLDPPLSTIAQPLYDMGAQAADRLIKIIKSKRKKKSVIKVMESKLVARESIKRKE